MESIRTLSELHDIVRFVWRSQSVITFLAYFIQGMCFDLIIPGLPHYDRKVVNIAVYSKGQCPDP